MAERAHLAAYYGQQPEPCQGCSMITDTMRECLGLCVGARSQEDIDARAALWRQIPTVFAAGAVSTPLPAPVPVGAVLTSDEPPF